ncbi:ATP-dependent nuclease subunit B [Streptococcus chenjunshii]|uniref:ATP-dependent helicase/deoxyribonuclease subunit B n=1 Tax=Streptococcus chenjunshii TaxID=2173853 RepID=A0A372KJV4_9STRE|nr:ATP-dependent nuclease subunit B [Streptococcus chenjunshii]AXQ78379.1 ATP-dependent nuclease subunit B [Streptococcus chenjunshii]RFU50338.1 ATP-dependent nuclease subunit B [Streptococcus chenjunshii]RFU52543.1 ATP-dependent nuclease subunit B [Streptococcus chenjunshii]
MQLLYTDIQYNITDILAQKAYAFSRKGKRVFYIAPSSLSFEKERAVLATLPEQASFAITVTRFVQMARYFVLNDYNPAQTLDDIGLSMLFYRALSAFSPKDLKVYGGLRQDPSFIRQLVDLYKELKTANLTVLDLEGLDSPEKQDDLVQIFTAVEDLLRLGGYDNQSQLAYFAQKVASGVIDGSLQNVVLIIDGFTRFSAEEEHLIELLHGKCADIVIGTYISQKAYKASFVSGNVYEASLTFFRALAEKFQTKPIYTEGPVKGLESLAHLSKIFEARHDFTENTLPVLNDGQQPISIWQAINQKEEIEHLARAIRRKLAEGYRYKDISVLLGDAEAYELQLGKIFDKYDIPYYFGKAESMSSHPLVRFIEALERLKRYNWRTEDMINLLQSGLFGTVSQQKMDKFIQYLFYADIKGQTKFTRDFTSNVQQKYDLPALNATRQQLISPLQTFFKSQKQLGRSLLQKFLLLLNDVHLTDRLRRLTADLPEAEAEQHEQVWQTFTAILEQFQTIFGQEKMSLAEFLSLLKNGILAAEYRLVPATLDVVHVKAYDLIEPHSNTFVFALGMTRTHFPKASRSSSLISDEERERVNASVPSDRHFMIIGQENIKKNHFLALSLFNAAHQELVLSLPQILNENTDDLSPYLLELAEMGVPVLEKGPVGQSATPADIGNYKRLLSSLLGFDNILVKQDLLEKTPSFWSRAAAYLQEKVVQNDLTLPKPVHHLTTKPVAAEVMQLRFPENQPLNLSASALTVFYNNQYKYFLQYVLGLQEQDSIRPDVRYHGTYLHKVFELLMQDSSNRSFDQKLERALRAVNQDQRFRQIYEENAESRYILTVLEDIARSTATVLEQGSQLRVQSEEQNFALMLDRQVAVQGIIDRIDALADGSLGIVDYKSSKNTFDIGRFYNGLSPQLVTYLAALYGDKQLSAGQSVFGAMYLQMQEPQIDLNKVKNRGAIVSDLHKELTYKGLFLENESDKLPKNLYHLHQSLYSQAELELLLRYNKQLYLQAASHIRKGKFLINPYSEDGRSVQGDQLKAITRFSADQDFGYARRLLKLPQKEKRQGFLKLMREGLTEMETDVPH